MKESIEFLELKSCQTGCACNTGTNSPRVRARVRAAIIVVPNPKNAGNLQRNIILILTHTTRVVELFVLYTDLNLLSSPRACGSSGAGALLGGSGPLLWPRFSHMSRLAYVTSRSLFATLALASSSRLRLGTPKTRTSRPLTGALSEKPRSQRSATRSKGQPPPPPPSAHHLSAAATRSTRTSHRTADHSSSSALRQQQHQQHSESSQTSPPPPSSREKRPLLRPYELSRRLIAHCEKGDVDLAVTELQRAPRNAQNIKVWNTIIQQCMSAKKYRLAYSVFTDVCIIPSFPPSPFLVFVTCQWLTKLMCLDETSRFRAKCQDVCHDDERLCDC